MTSILMFSQLVILQSLKLAKSSFGHDLVQSDNKMFENATASTNEENICSTLVQMLDIALG